MMELSGRNVNEVYRMAYGLLTGPSRSIQREPTRAGEAVVVREPVTSRYSRPDERVLFDSGRDANPFFHLFESLWMLGGRNDVEWLAQWLPPIARFSDNGTTFHGAYGHRWRHHFGLDQLVAVERVLRHSRTSRQAVIAMWDPAADLDTVTKDLPCNDLIKFDLRDGELCMMVCCRSNDAIWGAYGANVVHFSMLQEYLARSLDVPLGWYEQISLNFHAYTEVLGRTPRPNSDDPYVDGVGVDGDDVRPYPLMTVGQSTWLVDLDRFFAEGSAGAYVDPFFEYVAQPMAAAHEAYRLGDDDLAQRKMEGVAASDWRLAAERWLTRRALRRRAKSATPEVTP